MFFGPQIFLALKSFLDTKFFGLKIVLDSKFFWIKNVFGLKIFTAPIFWTKNFLDQKLFWMKNLFGLFFIQVQYDVNKHIKHRPGFQLLGSETRLKPLYQFLFTSVGRLGRGKDNPEIATMSPCSVLFCSVSTFHNIRYE